jgi:hypothetical protein
VTFNGPFLPDKLYFSEGLEYDLQKRPDRTLPFPFNETKKESVNSFTQLDYINLTNHFNPLDIHSNIDDPGSACSSEISSEGSCRIST